MSGIHGRHVRYTWPALSFLQRCLLDCHVRYTWPPCQVYMTRAVVLTVQRTRLPCQVYMAAMSGIHGHGGLPAMCSGEPLALEKSGRGCRARRNWRHGSPSPSCVAVAASLYCTVASRSVPTRRVVVTPRGSPRLRPCASLRRAADTRRVLAGHPLRKDAGVVRRVGFTPWRRLPATALSGIHRRLCPCLLDARRAPVGAAGACRRTQLRRCSSLRVVSARCSHAAAAPARSFTTAVVTAPPSSWYAGCVGLSARRAPSYT